MFRWTFTPRGTTIAQCSIDACALGAALPHPYKEQRWLTTVRESRKLVVTPLGSEMFARVFGVECPV